VRREKKTRRNGLLTRSSEDLSNKLKSKHIKIDSIRFFVVLRRAGDCHKCFPVLRAISAVLSEWPGALGVQRSMKLCLRNIVRIIEHGMDLLTPFYPLNITLLQINSY